MDDASSNAALMFTEEHDTGVVMPRHALSVAVVLQISIFTRHLKPWNLPTQGLDDGGLGAYATPVAVLLQ